MFERTFYTVLGYNVRQLIYFVPKHCHDKSDQKFSNVYTSMAGSSYGCALVLLDEGSVSRDQSYFFKASTAWTAVSRPKHNASTLYSSTSSSSPTLPICIASALSGHRRAKQGLRNERVDLLHLLV